MIAFRVSLNGGKAVTSGIGDGVACLVLHILREEENAETETRMDWEQSGLDSISDEHCYWVRESPLRIGDHLKIEIVEAEEVDALASRVPVRRGPETHGTETAERCDAPEKGRPESKEAAERTEGFLIPSAPVPAFRLAFNGGPPVTAGVDHGVTLVTMSYLARSAVGEPQKLEKCRLSVSGLHRRYGSLVWLQRDLKAGDLIEVEVVMTTAIDPEEAFY